MIYNGYKIHIDNSGVWILIDETILRFSTIQEAKNKIDYWCK